MNKTIPYSKVACSYVYVGHEEWFVFWLVALLFDNNYSIFLPKILCVCVTTYYSVFFHSLPMFILTEHPHYIIVTYIIFLMGVLFFHSRFVSINNNTYCMYNHETVHICLILLTNMGVCSSQSICFFSNFYAGISGADIRDMFLTLSHLK